MELSRPAILALVPVAWALVVLFAFLGRRSLGSPVRGIVSTVLRCAALGLLGLALAGPYRPFVEETDPASAFLPDRSGSVSGAGRRESDERLAELGRDGPVDTLPFGDATSSDPRGALLAAAARPASRIVAITDGWLDADSGPLLADLARAGRAAGVFPLEAERGEKRPPEPVVPAIDVPGDLRTDLPFAVTVRAGGADSVTLSIDGEELGRRDVEDGAAVFEDVELSTGRHEILAVSGAGGALAASARAVRVSGPLSVLVLGGRETSPFVRGLVAQGLDVSLAAGPPADLSPHRVIVAMPGWRLPADGAPIVDFVLGGGGLLVASGIPPAFAGYEGQAVADVLPLTPLPAPPEPAPPPPEPPPPEPDRPDEGATPEIVEKEAATLTVLLIVDRSGSMRGEKIYMARRAAYETARTLAPTDRLGVLAFNETFEWVRPLGAAGDLTRIMIALRNLQAGGGTEIFPAVKAAFSALRDDPSSVRHVILVSDGQDALTGFHRLVTSMVEEKITVSTVGVGMDYDSNFLQSISKWGHGSFYHAPNPQDLPRVVTLDTRKIVERERPPEPKPPRDKPESDLTAGAPKPDEGPERPPEASANDPVPIRPAAALPFLAGLEFPSLPEVEPTELRFPARIALTTADGDPALAFWRYGDGRVAAFPADPDAWAAWPDLGRFGAQLARLLAGSGGGGEGVPPAISVTGGAAVVRTAGTIAGLTARSGDGEARALSVTRVGPRRYRAPLPDAPPGTVLTIRADLADGASAIAAAVVPPPREESVASVDDAEVERLAHVAGSGPGEVPARPDPVRKPGRSPLHLVLLIAALGILPLDTAARRLFR